MGELPPEVQQALRQAFGWPAAGAPAAPPVAGAPGAAPTAPPNAPWPLQTGQVMLNGVPTAVTDTVAPRKPWWKRLFGG